MPAADTKSSLHFTATKCIHMWKVNWYLFPNVLQVIGEAAHNCALCLLQCSGSQQRHRTIFASSSSATAAAPQATAATKYGEASAHAPTVVPSLQHDHLQGLKSNAAAPSTSYDQVLLASARVHAWILPVRYWRMQRDCAGCTRLGPENLLLVTNCPSPIFPRLLALCLTYCGHAAESVLYLTSF